LRELNIYSDLLPCTEKIAELSWKPKGVVLSGGPYSVYEADAPHVDPAVFELGVPILGICYGLQEIAWHFGKDVLAGEKREYGPATLKSKDTLAGKTISTDCFKGSKTIFPSGCRMETNYLDYRPLPAIASTVNAPFAGIASVSSPYFGIQFHPEVTMLKMAQKYYRILLLAYAKLRKTRRWRNLSTKK
jgi:GMP synthase (glutamine-hydrolysing)